jgi:uncharacterized membrane protein YeaQ/YmgE (transglycosylase-associated protein family)
MAVETLVVFLLIGAIAGWLAGLLMRGFGFGLIGNIVVGILGAFVAGWLLPKVGITLATGMVGAVLHATIGAVILLAVVGLLKRA